jgi:hypothetical protein
VVKSLNETIKINIPKSDTSQVHFDVLLRQKSKPNSRKK